MAKSSSNINLLSESKPTGYSSFLGWALGIGKLIVIITEVIALGAFIYRFSLDKQITDLHSEIQGLQLVTESYANSEKTFRNLQSRLSYAKTYDSNEKLTIKILFDIEALFPQGVSLQNIAFVPGSVKLTAQAHTTDQLKTLTSAFQGSNDFSSVSLDQVQNSPSNNTLTASYTLTLR